MGMTKHANTLFPGDPVARKGEKIAGRPGKILDKTSHDHAHELRVAVEWPDGSETFERPEDLEKA